MSKVLKKCCNCKKLAKDQVLPQTHPGNRVHLMLVSPFIVETGGNFVFKPQNLAHEDLSEYSYKSQGFDKKEYFESNG